MRLSPSVGTGAPREAERDQRREGGAKNEDEEEDGDTGYLDVLRHYDSQGATSVCAGACDRVKLGTGGLSRAYSGGVVSVLEKMPREEKVDRRSVSLTLGYSDVDAVQRLVAQREWLLTEEVFGSDVCLKILVPAAEIDEMKALVADQTRGLGTVDVETEA